MENPFTIQNGILASLTVIATWLTTKGVQWYKELGAARAQVRKDRLAADREENQNDLDAEKAQLELQGIKDGRLEQGYKYLIAKRDREILVMRQEHREEINNLIAEMRQMRDEHKKEMLEFRKAHEECIEESARAAAERDATQRMCAAIQGQYNSVNTKYESLKRKVGMSGSDFKDLRPGSEPQPPDTQ